MRPADLTWRAGVDVLCFGGVKNGLAVGDCVVFFDRALSHEFQWRIKQAGQLNSKMRLVSAACSASSTAVLGSPTRAMPMRWRTGLRRGSMLFPELS